MAGAVEPLTPCWSTGANRVATISPVIWKLNFMMEEEEKEGRLYLLITTS